MAVGVTVCVFCLRASVGAAEHVPVGAGAGELRIASKSFTESVIVAEIVAQWTRASGIATQHRAAFGGTRLLWDALVSGAIDLYPEYTGTITQEILSGTPRPSPSTTGQGVTGQDATAIDPWLRETLAARGIGITGSLGFNNSYAIGVTEDCARRYGLTTILDLRSNPQLRFGFSSEFMSRQDGWPALRARYALPQQDVKGLDHDLAYRGLVAGAIDATDLYATDAEIRQYGLRVLRDDRQVFPRYDAVLLYRLDRLSSPAVDRVHRLEGRIDGAAMTSMNAAVKLQRRPEKEVAAAFLRAKMGVSGGTGERADAGGSAVMHTILARAAEHLSLVAVSLSAAIVVAVPLGVAAAHWPGLGQLVLAVVGIVQTVPSLALLVFMIPLFGIGGAPAIVALFLYSLLPIVRNTHAGLRGISPSLRESADALGLPPRAILRLVELPLASPLILAGIKSAAVINVGTATLGALIGAGGFGQPIFTGIRLDDLGLILQGAIPASILALLVQGFFDLAERVLVPRGLRATARLS
ncbi:MAG: glycine betaine ABC transporter substrate-binding protein [Myxococcales bacterium]